MGRTIMSQNLGMVIVLYNPQIEKIRRNFSRYYDSDCNVIFIVNSTTEVFKNQLISETKEKENIHLVFLRENVGIAQAQNIGINFYLKTPKITNIIFFDQDSYMEVSEINKLQSLFYNHDIEKPALIGPSVDQISNNGLRKVTETISSGSLIPVSVLYNVGMFKSKYFIDFVDYEWCWRAQGYGYNIYIADDINIVHQTEHDIRRRLGHTMEKPFRLYFVYRNLLWALRDTNMGILFETKWLFRYLVKALFQITIASDRLKRLKKITHGIFDGLFKYKG